MGVQLVLAPRAGLPQQVLQGEQPLAQLQAPSAEAFAQGLCLPELAHQIRVRAPVRLRVPVRQVRLARGPDGLGQSPLAVGRVLPGPQQFVQLAAHRPDVRRGRSQLLHRHRRPTSPLRRGSLPTGPRL
ncbi:hypothetical protein [Kitasatospora paranensis]|uniref:hypothetical protein n=1 Tax=Kitasatospora paranensis TaxID=258053 RepID=UPI0031E5BE3D